MKKIFLILFLFIATSLFAQVKVYNSALFTDGRIQGTFRDIENAGNAWSAQISDTFTRYTSKSLRLEVRNTDSTVNNGKRTEVAESPTAMLAERWFGLSIYFPLDYSPDVQAEIVTQWHEYPDFNIGETWRSPPVSLEVYNGQFHVVIYADTNKVNAYEGQSPTYMYRRDYYVGNVPRGQWVDFVWHINFSYKSDGFVEMWQNGVYKFHHTGPCAFNDDVYPYLKFGIYKWPWLHPETLPSDVTYRTLWYANVREGGPGCTYDDVDPNPSKQSKKIKVKFVIR